MELTTSVLVAPGGSVGGSTAATEIAVVLSSMCIAIECRAIENELAGDAALLSLYQDAAWKLPLERELRMLSDWSLANSARKTSVFQSNIAFPSVAVLATSPHDEFDVKEREGRRENSDRQDGDEEDYEHHWKHPKKRARVTSPPERDLPALFRLARIAEDPLEARWDSAGKPAPLRTSRVRWRRSAVCCYQRSHLSPHTFAGRNILGEPYAPRSNPLQFTKQLRAPSSVYQRVKRSVRAELVDREKRRIRMLNEKHRQQLLEAQRGAEQALEAKFDRLFVENNAPHNSESSSGAEKQGDGHETNGVSDGEDNQVAGTRVRMQVRERASE